MITVEVRQAVEEILSDGAFRARLGLSGFGPTERDQLDTVVAQVSGILQDRSLQAAAGNALWLNGASVVNGTITADKLVVNTLEAVTTNTGSLNVTGDIIAAASFPATGARVEINSDGLYGYSGAATTTFKLNVDGSGEIGTGSNKISWDTSGVLTVPVAIISSLTIAEVGTGNLGGTYTTSSGTTRLEFSSTEFKALASGTETFKLNASTGAVTMTGSFTVLSSATGAHVKIDNSGGIAGYNATSEIAGNRTFLLNAATGEGHLGISGITWTSGGSVSVPGSLLVNGTVTAGKLSVSTLSAITADLGTITAGTINGGTINATTITTGTLSAARISGGSVGGSFSLGSSNVTVNSTGVITNSDGDEWGPNGITLNSTGTFGDSIKWKYSGSDVASIYTTSGAIMVMETSGGGRLYLTTSTASISSTAQHINIQGGNGIIIAGRTYPGSGVTYGSAATQSTNWFEGSSSVISANLGGTGTGQSFSVVNSGGTTRFLVRADGLIGISSGVRDDAATSVSTVTSVWAIYDVGGTLVGYIPIYSTYG